MKNEASEIKSKKIVIIGGTGLVGTQLVGNLRRRGHSVTAASPSRGVDSVTGEGLAEALGGSDVVVDVTNPRSFEDDVLEFFETSTKNLLAAEDAAGVGHHVALSVVGVDRLPASVYFRAKVAQEKRIQASPVPYTIVRATQFFEFASGIAHSAAQGETVRLPSALVQPISSNDVADFLADVALAEPLNRFVELAGPETLPMDRFVREFLKAQNDPRTVITDDTALYFGTPLAHRSLTPLENPVIGSTRFEDWLHRSHG